MRSLSAERNSVHYDQEDMVLMMTMGEQVGRQVGSKNKRPRCTTTSSSTENLYTNARPSSADRYYAGLPGASNVTTNDAGHLPNPLHVLASEAYHRDSDGDGPLG
jgi:hypothetical protein